MGIDVKETGGTLWKVLGFSMNTTIKFMRNHPIFSGVSMFLLALYVILPSLFFFLIYSSPVLACGVVYVREKMGLSFPSTGTKSCGGEKDAVRCHFKQQRSVRRNARMQVEEWDSQTSDEEKDKVILTSLYNDLLGRTPHFEEPPKAIETEVVEDNEKSLDEEESRMSSQDLGYLDVQEPKVCNCEIQDEIREEMREEMSNANIVSVFDRDKRLESLIARRRTRRLFKLALDQHNKLQDEETSSPKYNINNLHVNVPRRNNNNSFEKRRNYYSSDDSTVMGLQVPSSAPSVMLQARNPFDIPYDPQEERPILSGDSFDQEFSFLDHKDMFFSRHESFSRLDLLSPEHAQCMNSPPPTSDITTTKKRLDLENEDMDHNEQNTIEDDNKCVESGELEVNNETDSNNEDDDDSSCSEESESEHNRFNKAELKEAISHTMDNHPSFLVNQARNGIPSPLPRGLAPPKLDDNNMFYARRRENSHSRTFSMASDMQVEVSEIGSPPTTVDWLDEWSNDGESYIYDTDIDREVIRGEESRKSDSSRCEQEKKWLVDEHLRMADDMYRRSQADEESFDQKLSSLSDVSKPTRGMLFHTSLSLSSITEEPEVLTKLVEHEVVEEKGPEQEKSIDEYEKPIEVDKIHDVLEASTSQPYIELLEDYANAENGSGVFLLQVQDSNNSTLDESADHVEEESIVLEDIHNSQDSQPWTQQDIDSSVGTSPRTLEITQQTEHNDAIYPNNVSQDIAEDIFAAAAKNSTATENNDEEKLKPDEKVTEVVEKELGLDLQPMDHNTGLVAKEDDEESKKVNGALHNAETKTTNTKTET